MKSKVTMKTKYIIGISSIAALVFAACNTANQKSDCVATSDFGEGVDSIKVEVSTKAGGSRSIVLIDNGDAVARFENKPDSTLSTSSAEELISLADSLFVKKTCEIILSKEEASGRTDYPIFKVTLYKGDTGETTRYDMGTQVENITHCTTCDIHYSPEFRHFVSQVFEILN